jgi:olfactory receptor
MTLMANNTKVTEFLLLGLTNDPGLQLPLFMKFLLIHTIARVGNLGIILLIFLDSCLHTPMYFFYAICPWWTFVTPRLSYLES